MVYFWAALRTLAILVGVFVGLLVLAAVASGVVNAFLYTFEAGCLALALIFGVLALFGSQLARISKTPRTRRVGSFARNWGGAIALWRWPRSRRTMGIRPSRTHGRRQRMAHGSSMRPKSR
jgi:hypothetical protein